MLRERPADLLLRYQDLISFTVSSLVRRGFFEADDKEEIIQECMRQGAHEFIHKDKDVATKVYMGITQIMEDEASQKKKKGFLGGLFGKLRG